jgi:hypothetical protein
METVLVERRNRDGRDGWGGWAVMAAVVIVLIFNIQYSESDTNCRFLGVSE